MNLFLTKELELLSKAKRTAPGICVLITIDGPAGSGKTSLAEEICEYLVDCQVINMDDLYRGWNNPFNEQLSAELLRICGEFKDLGHFRYSKFDWARSLVDEIIEFEQSKFLIIEGVGAGQRCIRSFADLSIWIEAPKDIALARVLARDGLEITPFLAEFNLAAEQHFEFEGTRQAARIHLSGV